MSKQVQFRRGSESEHQNFIGASGEITVDTTNNTIRVHDGETVGGTPLARESQIPEPYTMPTNYDFVTEVQKPTSSNGYKWYRKYKSGWVEQGGPLALSAADVSGNTVTVTLVIKMANTKYMLMPAPTVAAPDAYYGWRIKTKNQTQVIFEGWTTINENNLSWYVCGMAA